ncbi:conserved hypothetical protein [Haloferula helveola]|uniref:Leucine-rich repeat domain-containing protein n=1 Tax=Haloferula helveola TaxID=490095 RepID=A0ABM7RDT6_9BACT|nr:conserved hypothetical protein [Haloferula helveola]
MPIKRVGRFLETEDLGITHSLGIESGMVDECVDEVARRGLKGVFGSRCFSFFEDNLDFLQRIPATEQVWFWAIDLKNIDGLYALERLRHFGVHERRAPIDFSKFPELERMSWHTRTRDSGIEKLTKLVKLDLWRFKPKSKSYADLHLPTSLERLEINWSNPADLSGFPALPNLRELQLHCCRNLTSLEGIAEIAPNLKKLIVTRCANLAEYESARDLDLDHLYINIRGKAVAAKRPGRD